MSHFSDRLEVSLKHNKLQSKDLAKLIGIAKQTITAMKAGKVAGKKHLPAIALALGVDLDWLVMGDETKKPAWLSSITWLPNPVAPPLTPDIHADLARITSENARLSNENTRLSNENARLNQALLGR
jgi:transcriptional regulator with XRE-family HTH domain